MVNILLKCFCENSFSDERDFNYSGRVLKLSAVTFVQKRPESAKTGLYNDAKEKGKL